MATSGAAKVVDGEMTPLGPKSGPDDVVTEDDVKNPEKLARLLGSVVEDVAVTMARWSPRRIDFEDIAAGAGTSHPLQHNFNGRVRWWIVDWSDSGGNRSNFFKDTTATTSSTLVLTSNVAGIATIRVEEAG